VRAVKLKIPKRYYLIFAVLFFMTVLIIFAKEYMRSVSSGLTLYVTAVLPALFPFAFFSKILTELNFGRDIGVLCSRPLKKLYRAPNVSGYILVMSMLCGYPIGAKLIGDCKDCGLITDAEARTASAFTSTSGPLFIIGTLGVVMLENKTVGIIILLAHYLSALLNGLIYRGKKQSEGISLERKPIDYAKLLDVMPSAVVSLMVVGGYIVIFNLMLDVLLNLRIIGLFSNVLKIVCLKPAVSEGLLASLFEMTKGCLIISKSALSMKMKAALSAFAVTFGGVCVSLQSLTFLSKAKISPAYYFTTKLTQGIIAFLLTYVICLIFI